MKDQKKNRKFKAHLMNLLFLMMASLVLIVSIVTSVPEWRQKVRSWVQSPYREVLAKARADLTGQGDLVNVIKLKTQDGITVEVYAQDMESDHERFLARLRFDERRDGHFNIKGQATNLAIFDIDHDGIQEIIVPVFDENLIPRLHVFKFDPAGKVFVKMGPESVSF